MTTEERSDPTPYGFSITAVLSADKRTVSLKFIIDGNVAWEAAADTTSLDAMIRVLDSYRGQMLDSISFEIEDGKIYPFTFNPGWRIRPDPENRFAVLWIRNPGVGWYAYGFPRHEAGAIARWLRKIPAIRTASEMQAAQPPYATSIGSDEFLMTTSGLGFYYYGKGENRIGPNPFEQVEYDSDRAAGIVAGSIAEIRLEQALRSIMKADQATIATELFRPSGPLGPFRTKIDLAFMLGILSGDAYKDLTNIKNIRNDFAHKLEMDAFDDIQASMAVARISC
jgi:hypothetical protein